MPANFSILPSAPTKMLWLWLFLSFLNVALAHVNGGDQPLAKINVLKTTAAFHESASISAQPLLLGLKGEGTQWITVNFVNPKPTFDDWVGVFSPAKFDPSTCPPVNDKKEQLPYICSTPIMPILVAISTPISFVNPKAPLYPSLALAVKVNPLQFTNMISMMTVTWTSGYDIDEATPFVVGGRKGGLQVKTPAGTLTFKRNSICGSPARTVGWRDPGFTHTSFLKDLWPNVVYTYRMGHSLSNGSVIWSKTYSFTSSLSPGQNSLQRVIMFGDMGKAERDGSNEYSDYQPGALNTTDQLIRDLDNIDIVFHIGDLSYSNGYGSQWDQFTAQVEPIASTVPYMIARVSNRGRVFSHFEFTVIVAIAGAIAGVAAELRVVLQYSRFGAVNVVCQQKRCFIILLRTRQSFAQQLARYSKDYGLFHFCIADSEHDWREGSEQYKFIEQCLASADRHRQPWLIFAAHRVLGYSSNSGYGEEGSYEEPMGRESLQKLWQKYKVDIAFYGHVHNYERSCPIYQNHCMSKERNHYSGVVNGTIHVVVGGGGSHLTKFSQLIPYWNVYRDYDWGFVRLTAFNQSSLLLEYKKSRDGKAYDSFTISRDYIDVLAFIHDNCEPTTLTT
ncbi:putative inactive purple acid phosphatase 27 [Hibiscus syriacus]|uniref:Purple acid phosphatase n=1 Tax=Hibiscus syriacus TaxID=106335 RepID=A0A6A2YPU7_HIBSY|nr:putative inactive purple acid phosphatase 27 [Hibiscus syriacus]